MQTILSQDVGNNVCIHSWSGGNNVCKQSWVVGNNVCNHSWDGQNRWAIFESQSETAKF